MDIVYKGQNAVAGGEKNAANDCTGLVLAGGRGLRMGGADKGLVAWRGRPLAAHALDALAPQVRSVLISANRNAGRYAALGARVIADELEGFQGPLAGVHAALAQCETPWLVTVPCDMPDIPADLAQGLLRSAQLRRRLAAYAVIAGQDAYVCALLHRSLRAPLHAFLARGERAARRFLSGQRACAVAFDAPRPPLNLNCAVDVQAAAG